MRCRLHWVWVGLCCLATFHAEGARNVTIGGFTGGGSFNAGIFIPTADNATVSAFDINALLGSGVSVTITTGNTGTQAGDITLAAIALSSSTAASLTLNAAGSVTLNGPVT